MTKQEIVDKYYFYVRKKADYDSKIEKNNSLKERIYTGLYDCNDSMNSILDYADLANVFGDLYIINYGRYSIAEINFIDDIFDEVNLHLQAVRSDCEESIKYWYSKMINCEEE